jgi:raffinose/stachyose/melibiose transport system substrate-binding protein
MKRQNLQMLFFIFVTLLLAGITYAQDDPITITIWPNQYTPSRLLPTTGDSNAPVIQGIDPAVARYQELHPNVKIEIVTQAGTDVRTWLTSQLSGGIAPDIIWNQPDWAAEDYRKNWLVPIDSFLEQPNPYVAEGQPGSQHWHDMFEPAIDVWRAADDQLYVVLADQVQVGIYYNQSILDEAGVTEIPTTWEGLMQAAENIKTAGYAPFAQSGNNLDQLTWVSGWLTNFYYAPMLDEYDTSGDSHLSKTEMAQAVKDGKYSFNDEANRARLEEMKRFST